MFFYIKNSRKIAFCIIQFGLIHIIFDYFILNKKNVSVKRFSINNTRNTNPHDYKYIINPSFDICGNLSEILLIVGVSSAPNNYNYRYAIRSTWSNRNLFPRMRVIFLLGKSSNDLNEKIKSESDLYKDIVQEDFIDSYSNLSIKSIMGFKWAFNYCSKAKFYLKSDDDVIINSFYLLKKLDKMNKQIPIKKIENKIFCYYHANASVRRNSKDKFFVPEDEYKKVNYETYCDGPVYLTTLNLATNMYLMSLRIKQFRFEDVYMGILAKNLSVVFENWRNRYAQESQIISLVRNNSIITKYFFYPCHDFKFYDLWSKLAFFFSFGVE